MTLLDEYWKTKDNYSRVNDTLWPVLEGIPVEQSKPIHRVNDTMLLLLSIFAFEALCWECIHRAAGARKREGKLPGDLIPDLIEAVRICGATAPTKSELGKLYPIMNIRNLYAHGAGRRSGLHDPDSLPPKVLRKYLFESDECTACADHCANCPRTDLDTRWWPVRSLPQGPGAFTKCVGYLDALAPVVVANLTR